jgi:hypothetical protein
MLTENQQLKIQKIRSLRKKRQECIGKLVSKRINNLEVVLNIYRGNFEILEELLQKVKNIDYAKKLFSGKSKQSRKEIYFELVRLFHNYSFSISTLISITRNIMRKNYQDTNLFDFYDSKVDTIFKNNDTAKFLKELRNYFAHNQIPDLYQRLKLSTEKSNYSGFLLMREPLLNTFDWSVQAREFLNNCEEKFDLLDLINEYDANVHTFYNSIFEKLKTHHNKDLKEYENLKDEIKKLNSELDFMVL